MKDKTTLQTFWVHLSWQLCNTPSFSSLKSNKQLATSTSFQKKHLHFLWNCHYSFFNSYCNLDPTRHCNLEKKKIKRKINHASKGWTNHILSSKYHFRISLLYQPDTYIFNLLHMKVSKRCLLLLQPRGQK